MNYLRKSFNVGSPGTKDYAAKHDAIFRCVKTGALKSQCVHCNQTTTQNQQEK